VLIRPLNPYFSLLAFAACLAASYILLCRSLEQKMTVTVMLAFGVFAGFPNWFHLLEFKGTLFANSLAILFASLAAYLLIHERPYHKTFFVLFVAGALSIYQSALFITVVIVLAAILTQGDTRGGWRGSVAVPLLRLAGLLFLAGLLYLVIWKLLLFSFDLEVLYISGYVNLLDFLNQPGLILERTFMEAYWIYFGTHKNFHGLLPFTGLLFILGCIALFGNVLKGSANRPEKIALAALGILLIMTPFWLNLVNFGRLPYRTFLAVPFVFLVLLFSALQSAHSARRLVAKVAMVVVILQYLQLSSFASFSHYFVSVKDQLTAIQLYSRIVEQIPNYDRNKTYPIDFVGPLPFDNVSRYIHDNSAFSVTGSSFFEWDGGNPHRANEFLKIHSIGKFRVIGDAKRAKLADRIETMPLWPARGAVNYMDGVVVVRFGDYPEQIRDAITGQGAEG
jgi:hypothetical protein